MLATRETLKPGTKSRAVANQQFSDIKQFQLATKAERQRDLDSIIIVLEIMMICVCGVIAGQRLLRRSSPRRYQKLLIIVTKGNKDFISTECKTKSPKQRPAQASFLTVQLPPGRAPKRIIKKLSKQAIGNNTATQHQHY